jgi:hypothetical protein
MCLAGNGGSTEKANALVDIFRMHDSKSRDVFMISGLFLTFMRTDCAATPGLTLHEATILIFTSSKVS